MRWPPSFMGNERRRHSGASSQGRVDLAPTDPFQSKWALLERFSRQYVSKVTTELGRGPHGGLAASTWSQKGKWHRKLLGTCDVKRILTFSFTIKTQTVEIAGKTSYEWLYHVVNSRSQPHVDICSKLYSCFFFVLCHSDSISDALFHVLSGEAKRQSWESGTDCEGYIYFATNLGELSAVLILTWRPQPFF